MRNHAAIILFITAVGMAAIAGLLYNEYGNADNNDYTEPHLDAPEIIQVELWGIEHREAQYATITIRGGETALPLNETLITIETGGGTQDLPVR